MMKKRDKRAIAFLVVFVVVAAIVAAHLFSWEFVVAIYGVIFGSFLLLVVVNRDGLRKKK